VHVRAQAATNLLLKLLLPALVGSAHPRRVEAARFLGANHLLFLTLAMAAARALTAWAGQVEGASVVTTMARNGTTFGVRPGRGPDDGAPNIGDSAVLELIGLGGAAAAGSPAVGQLVGGTAAAAGLTRERSGQIGAGFAEAPLGCFRAALLDLDTRLAHGPEPTPAARSAS
jgi:hypothetical protein